MFLSHLIHQIIISRKNIFPPRKEISFRRLMKPGAFPKPMPFLKMLLASCSILFISLYCCFVSIRERLGTGCGHWTSVSHHPGMFSLKPSTTWRRTWSVNIKIMSTCWNNKRLKDREFVPGAVGFNTGPPKVRCPGMINGGWSGPDVLTSLLRVQFPFSRLCSGLVQIMSLFKGC